MLATEPLFFRQCLIPHFGSQACCPLSFWFFLWWLGGFTGQMSTPPCQTKSDCFRGMPKLSQKKSSDHSVGGDQGAKLWGKNRNTLETCNFPWEKLNFPQYEMSLVAASFILPFEWKPFEYFPLMKRLLLTEKSGCCRSKD